MVKKAKYLHITLALCMVLLGLFMIIWPTVSATTIAYIFGVVTLITGIIKIMSYFSKDIYNLAFQFDLALGVFYCVISLVLLFHPSDIVAVLPIVLGIAILIDGTLKLQTALDARSFGLTKWWFIILLAVATSIMGIFLMIKPFDAAAILMILMGITLVIDGIQNLCVTIYTVKLMRKAPDSVVFERHI